MNRTNSLIAFLLLPLCSLAQFTYERKVSEVTQSGWYRISLPAELLPKLKTDFADIRLYSSSNNTTEIPYLLQIAKDEISQTPVSLEPFNLSRQGAALFFTVKLNPNEPINSITLNFAQQNYDSEVTVEGSFNQLEWFKIQTSRIISLANTPVNYIYNHITFPSSTYTYLRFTIHKGAHLTLDQINFHQNKTVKGVFTEIASSLLSETIDKRSEFNLVFNQPVLLSRLSLEASPDQQFYRSVSIDWLYDSIKSEKGVHYQYQPLYTGVISSFKQDTLHFNPRVVKQIRVIVYNQDNPPVQIKRIHAWAPQVYLVTNLQAGTYTLRYGNEKMFIPNYDIEHFTKEIPASLPELQVSSELKPQQITEPETSPWFKNKLWMWGALGIIVVILGFFTIRMLREQ